jgi:hypothetical protein
MNKLTPEQIKTLEDAFASYPEGFPTTSPFASMEGVQEQLNQLEDGEPFIFYISRASMDDGGVTCSIEKMKVGTQDTEAQ